MRSTLGGAVIIIINGSKISVHRFIATTLFRMIEGWPHSSGNNEWPLSYKHWQFKAKLRLLWDIKTSRQLLWDVKTKVNPKGMLQEMCYFIKKKFLSRYLFLWGHELASSFLLFRLHIFFVQMITNFSKRHNLHLLLTLLWGLIYIYIYEV